MACSCGARIVQALPPCAMRSWQSLSRKKHYNTRVGPEERICKWLRRTLINGRRAKHRVAIVESVEGCFTVHENTGSPELRTDLINASDGVGRCSISRIDL